MIGLIAGGVGVAGLAVGTIFGFKAKSKENAANANCWPNDNTRCNHEGVTMIADGRTAASISNIGFIGGGIAIAGGALIYLTAPKAAPERATATLHEIRLMPVTTPSASGLWLDGKF